MAFICTKERGMCLTCEHYRLDEDYGGMCCFAQVDLEEQKRREKQKLPEDPWKCRDELPMPKGFQWRVI